MRIKFTPEQIHRILAARERNRSEAEKRMIVSVVRKQSDGPSETRRAIGRFAKHASVE